jgi:hypothetical protein
MWARLRHVWLVNYLAAFAALAAVKVGLIAYNIASPSASGTEPAY